MVAASSAGDPIWMGRMARLYPISIGKPTYRHCEHCEFRTGLRPVPLDETSHPPFHTLRPPFAGRTASLLLLFRTKSLPLGCFGTSLLAMTIQLGRRPLVAGANGGGIKALSKPFSKLLQNLRVLLQAFPNKS